MAVKWRSKLKTKTKAFSEKKMMRNFFPDNWISKKY